LAFFSTTFFHFLSSLSLLKRSIPPVNLFQGTLSCLLSLSLCVHGQLSYHFFSFQLSEQNKLSDRGLLGGLFSTEASRNVKLHNVFQGHSTKYSSCDTIPLTLLNYAVFRIHDSLVWIRIRIRGSMPQTNEFGSGCGSGSCYSRH
jgi:hypothetical protein